MLRTRLCSLCLGCLLLLGSCTPDPGTYREAAYEPERYLQTVKQLTDVIVHDIFSPPVASRIYAYPAIAAYEVMRQTDSSALTLAGQLRELRAVPPPPTGQDILFPLAALQAYISTGRAMVFSDDKMLEYEVNLHQDYREMGVPDGIMEASIAYGNAVSAHILAWAEGDKYKQTRTYPRYTVTTETGRWTPTPPDYMDGIEPHWEEIRPMVIDSSDQFVPPPPDPFDLSEGSRFYTQLMEVYEAGRKLDDEQEHIAKFWDCNPYVSKHYGHVMFATKKITPGGHWVGIATIACRKTDADFLATTEVFARTTIALFDAFISCWDEKYRSNLIRPETVINQHFDEDWRPLLQTPPFPEYTSGHSVISRAAAVALADYFGDNFAFHDTTEVEYGIDPRNFNSFLEASEEAAISRLYGGIHYMMAIENGVDQGHKVGTFVVDHLQTRAGRKEDAPIFEQLSEGGMEGIGK